MRDRRWQYTHGSVRVVVRALRDRDQTRTTGALAWYAWVQVQSGPHASTNFLHWFPTAEAAHDAGARSASEVVRLIGYAANRPDLVDVADRLRLGTLAPDDDGTSWGLGPHNADGPVVE